MKESVAMALLNLLKAGSLTGAQLETALGDSVAAAGLDWLLGVPKTVDSLTQNSTAFAQFVLSATACTKFVASAVAVTSMTGSAVARPLFCASTPAMTAAVVSGTAMTLIAADTNTTTELFLHGVGAGLVMTTPLAFNAYKSVPANYTLLSNQVNATGSKLQRQIFTASGTWAYPAGGVTALSVTLIGGGGNGDANDYSDSLHNGSGGSGAETITQPVTPLPLAAATITVGGAGLVTTAFGLTAAAGLTTTLSGPAALGGGATTGGGWQGMSDIAFTTCPWQAITASLQGGAGGIWSGTVGIAAYAGNGVGGTGGGLCGYNANSPCAGTGGSGYGSGGGGGYNAVSPLNAGAVSGGPASGHGCGGGGGGRNSSANSPGGAGSPGLVVVHWVAA